MSKIIKGGAGLKDLVGNWKTCVAWVNIGIGVLGSVEVGRGADRDLFSEIPVSLATIT